jgi:hypothetical protein
MALTLGEIRALLRDPAVKKLPDEHEVETIQLDAEHNEVVASVTKIELEDSIVKITVLVEPEETENEEVDEDEEDNDDALEEDMEDDEDPDDEEEDESDEE